MAILVEWCILHSVRAFFYPVKLEKAKFTLEVMYEESEETASLRILFVIEICLYNSALVE